MVTLSRDKCNGKIPNFTSILEEKMLTPSGISTFLFLEEVHLRLRFIDNSLNISAVTVKDKSRQEDD